MVDECRDITGQNDLHITLYVKGTKYRPDFYTLTKSGAHDLPNNKEQMKKFFEESGFEIGEDQEIRVCRNIYESFVDLKIDEFDNILKISQYFSEFTGKDLRASFEYIMKVITNPKYCEKILFIDYGLKMPVDSSDLLSNIDLKTHQEIILQYLLEEIK